MLLDTIVNSTMRIVFLLCLISSTTATGDAFQAGLSALERQHYATAMRAWLKLADQGVIEAQNNVGHMYEEGYAVAQNYTKAMNWYKKAAEQGLSEAQHNVGMLYYHGYGVAQNQRIAAKWFKRAAQQHLPEAQYMLGLCYYQGKGLSVDYRLARTWFLKSAKQAYANAQFMYAFMLQAGDGGESEPLKASLWAELAKRNGKTDATDISIYANLLIKDEDLNKVPTLADRCLETAYQDCPQ